MLKPTNWRNQWTPWPVNHKAHQIHHRFAWFCKLLLTLEVQEHKKHIYGVSKDSEWMISCEPRSRYLLSTLNCCVFKWKCFWSLLGFCLLWSLLSTWDSIGIGTFGKTLSHFHCPSTVEVPFRCSFSEFKPSNCPWKWLDLCSVLWPGICRAWAVTWALTPEVAYCPWRLILPVNQEAQWHSLYEW